MDTNKKIAEKLVLIRKFLAPAYFFGYADEPEYIELIKKSNMLAEQLAKNGVDIDYIGDIVECADYFVMLDGGAGEYECEKKLKDLIDGIDKSICNESTSMA